MLDALGQECAELIVQLNECAGTKGMPPGVRCLWAIPQRGDTVFAFTLAVRFFIGKIYIHRVTLGVIPKTLPLSIVLLQAYGERTEDQAKHTQLLLV